MNIEYFDLLDKWIRECPDKKVVIDNQGDLTYKQMDEQSARVYAWLKTHGIGREDFVMIHLPRNAKVLVAMQGIFKAGAAYVICPLDFPPERYDFVYRDCGCKLAIDQTVFDEMMSCDPLPGREDVDLHDAVYAVYTSGTQGNPKGVLHEYGNLDQTWKSAWCAGEPFVRFDDIYGLIAPHNFAVMNIVTVHALANGGTIYFAPTEIVKNPHLLRKAFEDAGVTVTYLPPSFLQVLNGFNPQLRKLMLSSELSRGVYYDDIKVINAHAMSECCFETATFLIDKPYDRPPIGTPQFDNKHYVIDGEYCFENKYFRGYINMPEKTKECFVDGIFHSGDMAEVLEDGSIVLTGRKDFMLKISGNRVEPADGEGLLQRGLGLKHVIVKGYKEPSRTYLCAYYTDDVVIDPGVAREKLKAIAPKYMIPDYYVKLDEFPLIANGKMDYQALKKPDINDYRKPYVAPRNDDESKVCAAFENVLGVDHIGIDDDFFEIGGDSLRAIAMVAEVNRDGFSSKMVYDYRTPRTIAEKMKLITSGNLEVNHVAAEMYATYMLDYQIENPESTLFNISRLSRFERNIDTGKIIEAFYAACEAHPMTRSVFAKEGDDWIITFAPEKAQKILVEAMSEEEFNAIRNDLVQPFVPGECVYHVRLIRTESAVYLFDEFHHPSTDGSAMRIFRRDFARAFAGEKLEQDHYFKCRAEDEALKDTDKYLQDKKYLDEKFDDDKWSAIPKPDKDEDGTCIMIKRKLPDSAEVSNATSLAAVLHAISVYNEKKDVMATWTYHARDSREKAESFGLMIRDIPIGIRIEDAYSKDDIIAEVKNQIEDGIRHMSYQWALEGDRKIVYTTTQGNLQEFVGFKGMDAESVTISHGDGMAADNPMDIYFRDESEGKFFTITYHSGMYEPQSAERFADMIESWYIED